MGVRSLTQTPNFKLDTPKLLRSNVNVQQLELDAASAFCLLATSITFTALVLDVTDSHSDTHTCSNNHSNSHSDRVEILQYL